MLKPTCKMMHRRVFPCPCLRQYIDCGHATGMVGGRVHGAWVRPGGGARGWDACHGHACGLVRPWGAFRVYVVCGTGVGELECVTLRRVSDVIVISDSSDDEHLKDAGNVSDDSDVVVLSVSSPPPEPSSSQQRLWSNASEIWDRSDAEDDQHNSDLEFIDVEGLISTSQRRNTSSQSSVVALGSGSQVSDIV